MRFLAAFYLLVVFSAFAREVQSINDGWLFSQKGDTTRVHLPHSWNRDAYSTTDYYRGEGAYTRCFALPEAAAGKQTYLQVDGAASKSTVLVDGQNVGSHVGAYSTYIVDLTPYFSDGFEHELTILVDNSDAAVPPYSADFTFMGGLYRDVSVVTCNPVHLDFTTGPVEGFKVLPKQGADGLWTVDVTGRVLNKSESNANIRLTAKLLDSHGMEVAHTVEKLKIKGAFDSDFNLKFKGIDKPELWTPENPALYTVELSVESNDHISDSARAPLGFRTYGFDADGRFLLNGEPYKLRGMCRHQDQAPMGIALTDEMHRRDMKMIKDMGANFIRISHYPQDDAVLEMCDRLGVIAWEEVPVIDYVPRTAGFDDNAEIMVRDMIRRHYNHPSIAMWGYMNEILLRVPGNERSEAYERTHKLASRLEEAVRSEDPDRLSTMAFHGSDAYHEARLSDITDVQGWNLYQGWYGGRMDEFEQFLSRQHREHPTHKLIVSEYGAGSDLRLHSLKPEAFDFSMEYQQLYLEHYLPVIEDSSFVAGASHWNFIDFSSAKRAESMPHINNKGLLTNQRRPKDVYYYYKAMWHDAEVDTVAHIAVTDWAVRTEMPDSMGRVIRPIKVYTNLPEVVLSINGVEQGRKMVNNRKVVYDVPLRDGKNILELRTADGTVVDTREMDVNIFSVAYGRICLDTDELAINVGSNCYFRSEDSGLTWLPDSEYTPVALYGHKGGRRVVTQDEIALTDDQPLLQRALNGLDEYYVALEPGRYEVELLFAEQGSPSAASAYMLGHNAGTGSDRTVMDIWINSRQVEAGFIPGDVAGTKTMLRRRYFTEVDSEGLSVAFGGVSSLAGIKVRKL